MFKYKVHYWDDAEHEDATEVGLVAAKSWGKAVEKVRDYYGVENVYNITIEEWSDVMYAEEIVNGLTEE